MRALDEMVKAVVTSKDKFLEVSASKKPSCHAMVFIVLHTDHLNFTGAADYAKSPSGRDPSDKDEEVQIHI